MAEEEQMLIVLSTEIDDSVSNKEPENVNKEAPAMENGEIVASYSQSHDVQLEDENQLVTVALEDIEFEVANHLEIVPLQDIEFEVANHLETVPLQNVEVELGDHLETVPSQEVEVELGNHLETVSSQDVEVEFGNHAERVPSQNVEVELGNHLETVPSQNVELELGNHLETVPPQDVEVELKNHLKTVPPQDVEVEVGNHLETVPLQDVEIEDGNHLETIPLQNVRVEVGNQLETVSSQDDALNESRSKRPKTENATRQSKTKTVHHKSNSGSKCQVCKQKLNDDNLKIYNGHPNDAKDEYSTLIDERLSLFNGNEEDVKEADLRAVNKITSFNIYCKNGHLCPFDTGLVDNEANIYLSGYVKPIYDDDPRIEGGIPCGDIGPIVEWFVAGFDGGQEASICLVSANGEYYLMQPSEDYAHFMLPVREKTFISKTVIEFLMEEPNSEYEDLLNKFETTPMPPGLPRFTEDLLIYHAQFVCDQIVSFDDGAPEEEVASGLVPPLIQSPCVQSLIDLTGVTLKKSFRKDKRRRDEDWFSGSKSSKQKKPSWTKTATTKEVHSMFESFFPGQLDNTADKLLLKRRRCGACEACLEPDCGECSNCKNMLKYGGPGTSKQACVKRRCPNMQIIEVNDGDEEPNNESDDILKDREASLEVYRKIMKTLKKNQRAAIEWVGEPIRSNKGDYYDSVMINSDEYHRDDYIFVEPKSSSIPMQVFQIKYLLETSRGGLKILHGTWLWRGSETILSEKAVSRELFLVDECQDIPLECVQYKANVVRQEIEDDVANKSNIISILKENSMLLFYQKRYDCLTARFEDLRPELQAPETRQHAFCSTCAQIQQDHLQNALRVFEELDEPNEDGMVQYGVIKHLDQEYRIGSAVYLKPKTFQLKYLENQAEATKSSKRELVDEEKYPEFYRKFSDKIKGSNIDTPAPFNIGYITGIYSTNRTKLKTGTNLRLKLKKFYRPENTHVGETLIKKCDLNILYWTDEECDVQFSQVIRKCYVTYSGNLDQDVSEWSAMGPDRFYFTEAYDSKNQEFIDPPSHALNIGRIPKDRSTKSKSKKAEVYFDSPPGFPPISRKLRTLDIFAGCGGLSEGLKQSGVAESLWAIENDEAAAHAYRLNNPNALVFTEDCNVVLEKVMSGETALVGQKLPQKGEVDLLCGGPPCQGFSAMNRFSGRVNSSFKNSLIVSFVSFCDYYRPRYVIMENVRNFATFKKGAVLKLTLSCLVRMGYQCTFGILQAGSYGVPQTRKRLILLAAATGEILPQFPSPLHVFSKSACHKTVEIDDTKYYTLKITPDDSAPYRVITVYDALSDLPPIRSGYSEASMPYPDDSTTAFQRQMRRYMIDRGVLYDHICKDMGPLIEARMSFIPIKPGSDWRDLPNIIVRLSDGTYTKKLEYKYHDTKSQDKNSLRGVCSCSEGKSCNTRDKQVNTLIPWCLPHTANRHNHWAGLYGRVEWSGFFSTTITNPEPMGKQGRVLHPEQHRLVSVRECARSQGFPDSFRFYGNIQEKHRQIGNAVPPPLAAAIGFEIRKSLSLKEAKSRSEEMPVSQAKRKLNFY